MTKKPLLKDILFNEIKIAKIAREIQSTHPDFEGEKFVLDVVAKFPELELKARISWIAACLRKYLPADYRLATNIIIRSLPLPNNPDLSDNDFGDFIYAAYAEYVAMSGCSKSDLAFSLKALYEITQRFSAEDAIRYFINAFPEESLTELQKWSGDSHYHVRRLCSEGTRPKLPWSRKINISAAAPIHILDNLFADKTRFVTRSVANHLNDISKIDPDLTVSTLSRWRKSGKQTSKEMDYITRHALRSLIKSGDSNALKLLGVTQNPNVKISNLKLSKKIGMNEALEFSFTLKAHEATRIIVDYVMYFQSKSGHLRNKKIFKLKNFSLAKGEDFTLAKRHLLRGNMTTRKILPGEHALEIQVNGKPCGRKSFWIEM